MRQFKSVLLCNAKLQFIFQIIFYCSQVLIFYSGSSVWSAYRFCCFKNIRKLHWYSSFSESEALFIVCCRTFPQLILGSDLVLSYSPVKLTITYNNNSSQRHSIIFSQIPFTQSSLRVKIFTALVFSLECLFVHSLQRMFQALLVCSEQ